MKRLFKNACYKLQYKTVKKLIIFICILSIVYLFRFLKADFQRIKDISHNNEKAERELKSKFHDDNAINLETEEVGFSLNEDLTFYGKSVVRPEELEIEKEMRRRRKFEFYRRLRLGRIDTSSGRRRVMLCGDGSCGRMIEDPRGQDNWQDALFGPLAPHIYSIVVYDSEGPNPVIGNSYIGVEGLGPTFQVAGLFSSMGGSLHRSHLPLWIARPIVNITSKPNKRSIVVGQRIDFDMATSTLMHTHFTSDVIVQHKVYAHRVIPELLIVETEVDMRSSSLSHVTLHYGSNRPNSNLDVRMLPQKCRLPGTVYKVGRTLMRDSDNSSQPVHIYHSVPIDHIDVVAKDMGGDVVRFVEFLTVSGSNQTALAAYAKGLDLARKGTLQSEHNAAWHRIWTEHSVLMWLGNDTTSMDRALISAQHTLATNAPSYGRTDPEGYLASAGLGRSSSFPDPMGFHNPGLLDYNQELWMQSSIALLNPASLRSMLQLRLRQVNSGRKTASRMGFKGVRFPVVTDNSGTELYKDPLAKFVHLTTGLVAIAMKRYLLVSGNYSLFRSSRVRDLMIEINSYWISVLNKSRYTKTFDSYGPDVSTGGPVTESAFNAGLIRESLLALSSLHNFFSGHQSSSKAEDSGPMTQYLLMLHNITDQVPIPHDPRRQFTPPYAGYNPDQSAPVLLPEGVMLRQPLDNVVDSETGTTNLRVYHSKLAHPRLANAVATLFIQAAESDSRRLANSLFQEMQGFVSKSFLDWSCHQQSAAQQKGQGCVVAAAAYIDSVIFGLLGVELRRTGLYLRPVEHIARLKRLEVAQIHYRGSRIRVSVVTGASTLQPDSGSKSQGQVSVTLVAREEGAPGLGIQDVQSGMQHILNSNKFPLGRQLVIKRLANTKHQ